MAQKKKKKLDQNKLGCGLGVTLNLLSTMGLTQVTTYLQPWLIFMPDLAKAMTRVEKCMRKMN